MPEVASAVLIMAARLSWSDASETQKDALRLATYVLGGNFSSRLMQKVRNEDGLTYGIRAHIVADDLDKDAYLQIHGTFAPENLEKGKESTKKVLEAWLSGDVSEQELKVRAQTLSGQQLVQMDTLQGVTEKIVDVLAKEKDVDYIDTLSKRMYGVSEKEARQVIAKFVGKFVTVVAGPV